MNFIEIDRKNWERREYFEHYLTSVPCTYSLTTQLDITAIKESGLKLYPTMLYYLTKAVNQHPQFRMAFRRNGQLVMYDTMLPCYTVFHKETETFSNIWTEYAEDYTVFCRRYQNDLQTFGSVKTMMAKPDVPENAFTVSMLPWASFDGFNLNIAHSNYLIPIFTMGKYHQSKDKYLLPLAVQVHHAVCDGYHICRFINTLQALCMEYRDT